MPPELEDDQLDAQEHAYREGQRDPENGQLPDRRFFLDLLDEGGNKQANAPALTTKTN